jgi:hypothetical protein
MISTAAQSHLETKSFQGISWKLWSSCLLRELPAPKLILSRTPGSSPSSAEVAPLLLLTEFSSPQAENRKGQKKEKGREGGEKMNNSICAKHRVIVTNLLTD